jgi:hypothetical protein
MTERVKAWQCIGCGRIEAPQTCVGVCEFNRIEMIYAFEHEQALEAERARCARFEALVRQLARITPRAGEWERSYRALQEQAKRAVAEDEALRSDTTEPR